MLLTLISLNVQPFNRQIIQFEFHPLKVVSRCACLMISDAEVLVELMDTRHSNYHYKDNVM